MSRSATQLTQWCLVLALIGSSACSTTGPPPMSEAATPSPETRRVSASGWVASADDVRIRYHQRGAGPVAIVFVHGWLCDSRYWRLQVPAFEERYRVVTLDLAGHGESGFGRERWTMQAFAADVAAAVRATEVDRIVLVGHSMGGPVVVEAARLLGDRVIGVVGVDTFRFEPVEPQSDEERRAAVAPFINDFENTVRNYVAKTMFVENSDPGLRDAIAQDMAEGPAVVGLGAGEGLLDYRAEDGLASIDVPFVLINSDYQRTYTDRILAVAPQARIELISGTGHFVMLEAPGEFNAVLEAVITDMIGAAAQGGS